MRTWIAFTSDPVASATFELYWRSPLTFEPVEPAAEVVIGDGSADEAAASLREQLAELPDPFPEFSVAPPRVVQDTPAYAVAVDADAALGFGVERPPNVAISYGDVVPPPPAVVA